MMNNHPYHMVTISPWPLMMSLSLMISLFSFLELFHLKSYNWLIMSNILSVLTMYQWWRDIIRESTFQGMHTKFVMKNMQMGMILFIISELFFFISFFWTFFHMSISPSINIGAMWPPMNIIPFNPFHIPLLNTIILITSGMTITTAHFMLINNNFNKSKMFINWTIMLGIYFSIMQLLEYKTAPFSMNDSIYGSIFFMATGFHGLHVIIGTIFISINLLRLNALHFSKTHHFGIEAAIWYWHFVDIIWLFLYFCIYW